MLRRIVNFAMLAAGGTLVAWAARQFSVDPPRAAAAALLGAVGLGLNLTGLTRAELNLRPWLRLFGIGMALVTLAAVGGRWYVLTEYVLPTIPRADIELRATFATAADHLRWIAAALIYDCMSVLALPRSSTAAKDRTK